jgi:integrase
LSFLGFGENLGARDDCNDGSVATAMRLLVMLPVRLGELMQMRWEDVDLVSADWHYVGILTAFEACRTAPRKRP